MRQIEVSSYGVPEVLAEVRADCPCPSAGQVLIQVAAAGVNRLDCFQRAGHYPPPLGASPVLGLEVSGEIVEIAPDVVSLSVGDRVCALLTGGGYAEYAVADAALCLPVPVGCSLEESASLPEAAFTAWSMLWQRASLKSGESLLVQGGASGVGTFAVQLARAMGHSVYATAGSLQKCELAIRLGAKHVFNYKTQDFVREILTLTDNHGVDVILDVVGGPNLNRHLDVLAEDGRLAIIAFLGGASGELNVARLLKKRLTVTASALRARSLEFKTQVAKELQGKVWPLLQVGLIKPVIHARLPLSAAAEAHQMLEQGQVMGKVLLIP